MNAPCILVHVFADELGQSLFQDNRLQELLDQAHPECFSQEAPTKDLRVFTERINKAQDGGGKLNFDVTMTQTETAEDLLAILKTPNRQVFDFNV
jgi:hypothetical protein